MDTVVAWYEIVAKNTGVGLEWKISLISFRVGLCTHSTQRRLFMNFNEELHL